VVVYRSQQLGPKIKQTRPKVYNYVGLKMRLHLMSVFKTDRRVAVRLHSSGQVLRVREVWAFIQLATNRKKLLNGLSCPPPTWTARNREG